MPLSLTAAIEFIPPIIATPTWPLFTGISNRSELGSPTSSIPLNPISIKSESRLSSWAPAAIGTSRTLANILPDPLLIISDNLRYDSTTLDPLDVFMSQELTSVLEMINTGSGKILSSVREVPMAAGAQLESLLSDLMDIGFKGILEVGEPNSDLLEMPVSRGHIGVAIIGGINSMAAVKESGIEIQTNAISGLANVRDMDYNLLLS